jgi:CMP/dCMP kinase
MKNLIIAIDGPAGAGKSTISKIIAKKLKIEFIDTGAMYRAVTLKVLQNNIDLNDEEKLSKLLDTTSVNFIEGEIFLDDKDVSKEIRLPEVNDYVSEVSTKLLVRKKLVELQRKMSENINVIMDGRDIGTYVLSNATFKIFLTASVKNRAERRYLELKNKGIEVQYNEVYKEIEERDLKDCTRKLNPLTKANDAILVNTTDKSIDTVVDEILKIINEDKRCK